MQEMFRLKRLATTSLVVFGASCVAANAAGKYDGNWVGVPIAVPPSSGDCSVWRTAVRLRVVDDKFNQEVGGAAMQGVIAPDGSFSTSGPRQKSKEILMIQFTGKITGDQLNAVWRSKYCTMQMPLRRQ